MVKLGGSTVRSPSLRSWIAAIELAVEPVVVVPGGGPFADTIRRHQAQLGYDDATAHEMSVLAMEQFGCVLLNLSRRFVAADSEETIATALETGRVPVWLPRKMVMSAHEIPQDWTVTSDSLSAWLQTRLDARNLCLVKLIDVPKNSSVDALSRAAVVDMAFPTMISHDALLYIAGPADLGSAGRRFSVGDVPGQLIPTSAGSTSGDSVEAAE
ncbi:amino acid kinase [Fulvimarina sp. 2208YS6-2-32]|uniref:Amino acid kinase n=1 Tax=Fulvimarina uroteuthidis TaxID=3098149 RepID=A0ABU5HXK3_9HYPH|nr:amino acid kinase [Fulvimarina sp. 2208YS6-2-32]